MRLTRQLIVVESPSLRKNTNHDIVALFGPGGEPLVLKDNDEVTALKSRVAKLESRVKTLTSGEPEGE